MLASHATFMPIERKIGKFAVDFSASQALWRKIRFFDIIGDIAYVLFGFGRESLQRRKACIHEISGGDSSFQEWFNLNDFVTYGLRLRGLCI